MTAPQPGPSPIGLLTTLRDDAAAAERRVIDAVLADPAEMLTLTASEIARRSAVSEATVVRVWRKAGFDGFQEMKLQLARELALGVSAIHEEVAPEDGVGTILDKVFQANVLALGDTRAALAAQTLERAAELFLGARQILVCGVGNSGLLAQDAEQKWLRVGLSVRAAVDGASQAIHAALLRPGDLLVALSHSGTSRDVLEAAVIAREGAVPVVAITRRGASPLADLADVVLGTVARETAFRSEAMSSRLAMLSIIDALFVILALRRQEPTLENLVRIRRATRRKHVDRRPAAGPDGV